MELILSLLYISISLFIVFTLTVFSCASEDEDEDDSKGQRKKGCALPKVSKVNSVPGKAKQKGQSKVASSVPGGKMSLKESATKKMLPTSQQTASKTTKTKRVTVCQNTTSKEEAKTTTGTKPKLPAFPEELGLLLVDQKFYDKLKKKYDLSSAPPSSQGGNIQSNIFNKGAAGSGGASHLSHFKTQSFAESLSKLSTKIDIQSAGDGTKVEVKKMDVKEKKVGKE